MSVKSNGAAWLTELMHHVSDRLLNRNNDLHNTCQMTLLLLDDAMASFALTGHAASSNARRTADANIRQYLERFQGNGLTTVDVRYVHERLLTMNRVVGVRLWIASNRELYAVDERQRLLEEINLSITRFLEWSNRLPGMKTAAMDFEYDDTFKPEDPRHRRP